jgi:surface carbohydrate biosynthesis protein
MKYLTFILRFIFKVKIIFKDPKKYQLVIFDNSSIEELEAVLKNRKYFILESRIDKISKVYISLNIIKLCIKNYKNKIWTAYLVSLLDIIQPKVVFTFIDNSLKFSEIAKLRYNKINFVALQNGARYEHKEHAYLYKKKIINYNYNSKFFIPYLLCYGKHEINEFKKYNIKVINFSAVGSLRVSNFLSYKKKKIKFFFNDICLISDAYAWDRAFDCFNSNLEKGIINLVKFVIRFCKQYNLKLTLALRSYKTDEMNLNKELDFYKKYLTQTEYSFLFESFFYREEKNRFRTYELMKDSKVVIGSISTTLRENLIMNGKTLACNFTPTEIFDFPIKGLCFIKNCNYRSFEERLLKIINISKEEYFSQINRNYAINYDKNISTAEKVNNKLDLFLKKI